MLFSTPLLSRACSGTTLCTSAFCLVVCLSQSVCQFFSRFRGNYSLHICALLLSKLSFSSCTFSLLHPHRNLFLGHMNPASLASHFSHLASLRLTCPLLLEQLSSSCCSFLWYVVCSIAFHATFSLSHSLSTSLHLSLFSLQQASESLLDALSSSSLLCLSVVIRRCSPTFTVLPVLSSPHIRVNLKPKLSSSLDFASSTNHQPSLLARLAVAHDHGSTRQEFLFDSHFGLLPSFVPANFSLVILVLQSRSVPPRSSHLIRHCTSRLHRHHGPFPTMRLATSCQPASCHHCVCPALRTQLLSLCEASRCVTLTVVVAKPRFPLVGHRRLALIVKTVAPLPALEQPLLSCR